MQLLQGEQPGGNDRHNAPDKEVHMQTMNDEGDIQLVDDMELFSQHERDRYDDEREEGDELEYQTNDIEDSSRICLIPRRDGLFNIPTDDYYENKEPLSLQIKSKL